jgi:hypothetical protein
MYTSSQKLVELAKNCACQICRGIVNNEYTAALANSLTAVVSGDWRIITVRYGPKPCQFPGCNLHIPTNVKAWQRTGIGLVCESHGKPPDDLPRKSPIL